MVVAYYGSPSAQGDIARWLATTEIGTPARNITRLQNHGFNVLYQEGSLQFLMDALGQGVPPILFIRTAALPYWQVDTAHAITLAGLEGEQAFLHDPFFVDAPKIVSVDALMLAWSFFDYMVAALTPLSR
jgi:hypothetical protein